MSTETTKLERLQEFKAEVQPALDAYTKKHGEASCVEKLVEFLILEELLYGD